MNRDFNQIYISNSISHFKKNMKKKWGLVDYHDNKSPAIFWGAYNKKDLKIILNHKSYGIMLFAGNDLREDKTKKIFDRKRKTFFTSAYGWRSDLLNEYGIHPKKMILPVKDYSNLKPAPLGKCIYIYIGQPNNQRYEYFKYDEIIVPLIEHFGEKRVIWVKEKEPISFNDLVTDYYTNSFIYIKPNERGGSTSMWDMGFMGRKTIANNQGNLPNVIGYKDLNHMIDLIYEESNKIGTIQEDIHHQTKQVFQTTDEWLYLKFWLK